MHSVLKNRLIINEILQHLSLKDVLSFECTCSYVRDAIQSLFWTNRNFSEFNLTLCDNFMTQVEQLNDFNVKCLTSLVIYSFLFENTHSFCFNCFGSINFF